jgi:hypothetical protein
MDAAPPNLVLVDDCLWICEDSIGVPGYDFRFQDFFTCRHPVFLDREITAVARLGAAPDYRRRYERLLEWNVRLVHTPEEYDLTSNLPLWYPRISRLTPKSIWYEHPPTVAEIEAEFQWPVFLKGERQTSKHDRTLSIISGPEHFRTAMDRWKNDDILHWQKVVCRQFTELRQVAPDDGKALPKTFEFRTFWWKQTCVGIGRYWTSETYALTSEERLGLLEIGRQAAAALDVTFLVIDLAMTAAGDWIVIECNDGQDFGYGGVSPFLLWQNVVAAVKEAG